jgi:uncharacterized membrane protein
MATPVPSAPKLTVVRAWTCLGINLFATPGMGSVMGGRKLAGRGQLLLSIAGFCLIVMWIIKLSMGVAEAQIAETDSTAVLAWWWQWGLIFFGAGWVWSLVTSISLVIQATKAEGRVPPKL